MGFSAVQIVCVPFGVIGLIGVITCCALPQWKLVVIRGHSGETKWIIPPYLHPARAMTIISCILSGISLLILFFGVMLTTYLQKEDAKPKIILVAGAGLLLAGLLVIIPVSWVTHFVNEANMPNNSVDLKIGASSYIGWAAAVLMILAGGLLCGFSRPRSSSSGGTARYYSNSASAPNSNVR
ncbi:claudin-4-like [Anableps anableps]